MKNKLKFLLSDRSNTICGSAHRDRMFFSNEGH